MDEIEVSLAKQRKIIADAGAAIAALDIERAELLSKYHKTAKA